MRKNLLRKLIKTLFSCVVLLFVGSAAYAQNSAISGTVLGQSGTPVIGASSTSSSHSLML